MCNPNLLRRSSIPGFVLLASVMAPAADFRISGPYTRDNLSIFLLHGESAKAAAKLLTLQEAMDQQKVVVFETGQVNELSIENRSAQDVYVQSGDIVKGGRQDRVLVTDLILPAHSGKLAISAFCVEHGRWTKRGNEQAGQFSASNRALPAKALKIAVREEKDQSKVWAEVANTQARLGTGSGYGAGRSSSSGWVASAASASPTSMQLALEDKTVVEQTAAYVQHLAGIIDGKNDVVGYAYAINGKLNSAEVYDSHDLFRRMWPKMLQASAAEALAEKNAEKSPGQTAALPDVTAVKAALAAADRGPEASTDSTGRVSVVKKVSDKVILFESRDRKLSDEWIHKSYVVK
jgi:hypothetical protein